MKQPSWFRDGFSNVRFSNIRYVLLLFISSRVALTIVGLFSMALLDRGYGKQFTWSRYPWLDIWGVWDTFWYMDIAQNGYSTIGPIASTPNQTNFPFFPLYPGLMHLLGKITNGEYYLAGIVISNVALVVAGYLLYKLVAMDSGHSTALRSVKYLFLYPVAFIFSGVFTESLYLCLTLLCFYLAKQQKWWLAGLAGALLSATRTLGILIVLPLAFEYGRHIDFKIKNLRLNSLFVLLIPSGLAGFCLYSYQATGDFFYFKSNQSAWGREILNPVASLWIAIRQGVTQQDAKTLTEIAFTLVTLLLLTVFFRKINFSYWLYGLYSILIPLSAGILSIPRYTLPIFPLFIALAHLSRKDKAVDDTLTIFCGCLQGCLMVFWCTGQSLIV